MSEYRATMHWRGEAEGFLKGRFSREHTWTFDGGITLAASASPSVVPAPYSNPANIDPEEALVASIASCHMLSFLHIASKTKFIVVAYDDEAVGVMTKNETGAMWVSQVTLHPKVTYAGEQLPTADDEARLHHQAHEVCFIANSVKTEILVVPTAP